MSDEKPIMMDIHPELLKIRAGLTEAMFFGVLRHDFFDSIFKKINTVYMEEEAMRQFISAKELTADFEQFCNFGHSE